jgi:transcriptional regulator with XRE-family HTH domain
MTFKIAQTFNGERLRQARLAKNMTTRDLAEKLGVNCSLVSRWESGKNKPHKDSVAAMAKILKIKVRDLDEVEAN